MERQAQIEAIQNILTQRKLDEQLVNLDNASDTGIQRNQMIGQIQGILAQRKEAEAKAANAAPKAPDSMGQDTLDVAAEFAAGVNSMAAETADMFTAPFRVTGEFITGKDVRSPTEVLEDMTGFRVGQGGYMDEGLARDAVRAAGVTTGVAAGLKGVQRGGEVVGNSVLDIIGFGSTELGASAKMAEKTAEALKNADQFKLSKPVTEMDDDELWRHINIEQRKRGVELNRSQFNEYEAAEAANIKASQWDEELDEFLGEAGTRELADPISPVSLNSTLYSLPEEIDPNRVLAIIRKKGGLRFDDSMDDLIDMDTHLSGVEAKNVSSPNWYNRNFVPVANVIKRFANAQVGAIYERGVETATRYTDQITSRLKGIEYVAQAVENTPKLKGMILEVGTNPKLMPAIRAEIGRMTGQDGLAVFDEFRRLSDDQNARALKSMFKQEVDPENADVLPFGDQHYFHTEAVVDKDSWKRILGRFGRSDREAPSALRVRSRKPGQSMTDEELATYQNPIMSQLKHLTDQEQLLQLSEKFKMRNSLDVNGNTDDFFNELKETLMRNGFSESQAGVTAEVANQAHMGAKLAPPAAVRTYMNLSYAGTLAQFKSATLNLHDIAVSAVNNGGINTLKGLFSSTKKEFGRNMEELGFSGQAVGEYMRGFEGAVGNTEGWEKVASVTHAFTDRSMRVSLFRAMDHIGKGTVLRANMNKMRNAAKKGELYSEFSDLAYKSELEKIQPYLAKGMKVGEMPADVAKIVEEVAFTSLGKQQLISHAGRPLNYLRNPLLRPAYAMTGFAIKQQAMLADNVFYALKDGKYAEAGAYAAKYAVYAAFGYAAINQGRSWAFKNDREIEPEDFLIDAGYQVTAALTLNRIGSDYDLEKIAQHGFTGFLLQSLLPPGGMVEAAEKDLIQFFRWAADPKEEEFPDNLAQKVPALGDFYKYYMKE